MECVIIRVWIIIESLKWVASVIINMTTFLIMTSVCLLPPLWRQSLLLFAKSKGGFFWNTCGYVIGSSQPLVVDKCITYILYNIHYYITVPNMEIASVYCVDVKYGIALYFRSQSHIKIRWRWWWDLRHQRKMGCLTCLKGDKLKVIDYWLILVSLHCNVWLLKDNKVN